MIASVITGPLGDAVAASSAIKTQLDTLTEQAATGYVSQNYAGLGSQAGAALSLQPQIANLAAQQSAISTVVGRLGVTQTALTQISTIASDFNAKLPDLNDVTPSQIDSVAADARLALQQVASLLDTTDGSDYVFGGTNSAVPPVPNPDDITSSAFFTQIGAAVSGLGANGAAATVASTLAIASSDAAGTTPFSGPPGTAPTLDLSSGGTTQQVQVGVLANANTLAVSSGSSTTGSYTRDILRGLATLANLSSGQATDSGFTALVQDTQQSLSGAITAMGQETGALGDTQTQLTTEQTAAGDTTTALNSQLNSVENVDTATTISELTQVQTQLTASYKLISELSSLSLVNFLGT